MDNGEDLFYHEFKIIYDIMLFKIFILTTKTY